MLIFSSEHEAETFQDIPDSRTHGFTAPSLTILYSPPLKIPATNNEKLSTLVAVPLGTIQLIVRLSSLCICALPLRTALCGLTGPGAQNKNKNYQFLPRWPRLFDVALDLRVSSPIYSKLNKPFHDQVQLANIYVAMFLTIPKQILEIGRAHV